MDEDNLQVQWGSQDHYEIVRKVGRGKYSEVCLTMFERDNNYKNVPRESRFLKASTSSMRRNVSSRC